MTRVGRLDGAQQEHDVADSNDVGRKVVRNQKPARPFACFALLVADNFFARDGGPQI